MDFENAQRLLESIPDDARVVDVGGGAAPFPRADYVIDAMAFEGLGSGSDGNINERLRIKPRYSKERWIQVDLCDRRPWPIADKTFDFAICSHLLEDIRDPIWVCSELRRIAKSGYIEVPSRVVEQSKGIENPRHAGYYHHRWLIKRNQNGLEFRHKPHVLHSVKNAIVKHLSPGQRINPRYGIVTLDWSDSFEAKEVLEFDEVKVIRELCEFASEARGLPDLTVKAPMTMGQSIKRHIFYYRLRMGQAG
jgi:ubiquinone/menaquinone biosynthesis C-methylase UbiE